MGEEMMEMGILGECLPFRGDTIAIHSPSLVDQLQYLKYNLQDYIDVNFHYCPSAVSNICMGERPFPFTNKDSPHIKKKHM